MLDFTPPKQEYWFNVYNDGKAYGLRYGSKDDCECVAYYGESKPSYRIHVKLK